MAARSLRHDDRGLAMGGIAFIAILVVAALLFTLLDPALAEIFGMASSQADSQTAQDVIDERKQIWGLFPIFAAFMALIALIAHAVFESRSPV